MATLRLFAVLFALAHWQIAPAAARSVEGPIMREDHAGRVFLHRALCAADARPMHMHCHAHLLVKSDGNAVTAAITPSGFGAGDLRTAYRLGVQGSATTVIAIVDAFGYPKAESDLATYRAQYGLPPCTSASGCFTKVNQRGDPIAPKTDTGWAQEQALDIQMASAMCPNCRILLIQADDDTVANLAASVTFAASRGAAAISNSYGGPEAGTRAYASVYRHAGIAITASAGDSGYGAEFPASAPATIAVGGTKLVRNPSVPRGWVETVWSGSGSGCSAVFPKPAWQTDTLCTRRMMNDVAVVAAPSTGVAVFGPIGPSNTSGWLVFGGTSIGAPLIAGIYAAAGARPTGARSLWRRSVHLNDVLSGSNGKCGGTYFCIAGVGYDGPTGNGTPIGKAAF